MAASRHFVILAVALAWTSPAVAGDDTSLAQARRDVDSSDYPAARTDLIAALNAGNADPDALAEIYKLTGIVESALGHNAAATTAFGKWIELDPKAALPGGTSPKIMRPFEAAQKRKETRLELKPETRAEPPRLTVAIASDPMRLVARARVFCSVDGKPELKVEAGGKGAKIDVDLPHGKRLDCRAEVLDEHGNRVAVLGSRDVPIVITSSGGGTEPVVEHKPDRETQDALKTHGTHDTKPTDTKPTDTTTTVSATTTTEPSHRRSIALSPYLWGGVALALAGGATYFGLAARSDADKLNQLNANSQNHTFSEAQSVQHSAENEALLFNIGIAAAGGVAIFATYLYVTQPRSKEGETRVSAVPAPGGGVVFVGGAF